MHRESSGVPQIYTYFHMTPWLSQASWEGRAKDTGEHESACSLGPGWVGRTSYACCVEFVEKCMEQNPITTTGPRVADQPWQRGGSRRADSSFALLSRATFLDRLHVRIFSLYCS